MLTGPGPSGRARVGTAVAYALTASLVAYLHYFGLYLVAWQALGTGLFRPWRDRRAAAVVVTAYGVFIVLYAPWLPSLVAQFLNPNRPTAWITRPSPDSLVRYLQFLFNGSRGLTVLAGWRRRARAVYGGLAPNVPGRHRSKAP